MKRLPISAKNYPGERSCAAATWTPLRVSGGATEEKLKQFGGKPSMGRPDQPEELGFFLVQLAASDASYPTRTTYDSAGERLTVGRVWCFPSNHLEDANRGRLLIKANSKLRLTRFRCLRFCL